MFHKVKRVMTALFVLFLLFAFTLPGTWAERRCDELLTLIGEAEAAGNPTDALDGLAAQYEKNSRIFRLFLSHDAVEAVAAAIAAARPIREREALLSALSVVREAIAALRRIERLELL